MRYSMKKIIFFDGDGTLWYPKQTKRQQQPQWVYTDPTTASDPLQHLVLTPSTLETLNQLKAQGIKLVILSTHPQPAEEASLVIQNKVHHFSVHGLFDEIHATRPYEASKGEFMVEILARKKIPKKYAMMVGDMYDWDYYPARKNGITAVLIDSAYRKEHPHGKKIRRTIPEMKDVLNYI